MDQADLTIVSGLALGVDGAASASALDAAEKSDSAGLTVAVVGTRARTGFTPAPIATWPTE